MNGSELWLDIDADRSIPIGQVDLITVNFDNLTEITFTVGFEEKYLKNIHLLVALGVLNVKPKEYILSDFSTRRRLITVKIKDSADQVLYFDHLFCAELPENFLDMLTLDGVDQFEVMFYRSNQ